jgi:hypothetical protein
MPWTTRRPVSVAQLQLGLEAWRALTNPDPRPLAAIVRRGTPELPLLAPALHRHLRELPAIANGLSLTEELALKLMAEPPPRLGPHRDFQQGLLAGAWDGSDLRPTRRGLESPWTDVLAITELGRGVPRGEVDFRSLNPVPRRIGGVEIAAGKADWRWDERLRDAVRR